MIIYKDSGVDIKLGNKCSQIMYEASRKTFVNREGKFGEPIELIGGFSGPVRLKGLKEAILVKNSDGVGTKVEVAQLMEKHDTIAFDLLAMVCDDAASMGAEPFALTNTLNVRSLSPKVIGDLAKGLVNAAKAAQVAVVGGEIAELGDKIKSGYIWDADVVAIMDENKWKDVDEIFPGDKIWGVESEGFRSNGYSLIRKILEESLGTNWPDKDFSRGVSWGELVLEPSRIYTPFLTDCYGALNQPPTIKIKKIAHITGGGIPGNLSRILPSGLGATIEPPKPHKPMLVIQKMGQVPDEEAYRTWNMGVGLCIVTNDETILKKAIKHNLRARIVGEVVKKPTIEILNKGYFQKKGVLCYEIC